MPDIGIERGYIALALLLSSKVRKSTFDINIFFQELSPSKMQPDKSGFAPCRELFCLRQSVYTSLHYVKHTTFSLSQI
jgi:hypothetical protein